MAYEKHTWRIGEDFSSWKMNHIKEGIANAGGGGGGGITVVHTTLAPDGTSATFQNTFAEVKAMLDAGSPLVLQVIDSTRMQYLFITGYDVSEQYGLAIENGDFIICTSEDEYPVFRIGG